MLVYFRIKLLLNIRVKLQTLKSVKPSLGGYLQSFSTQKFINMVIQKNSYTGEAIQNEESWKNPQMMKASSMWKVQGS